MKAGEYQRAARTVAIYPASAGVYYPALGLAGEIGEIANKAKKIIRGDVTFEARKPELVKELGDVLWYVAALASDCALDLEDIVEASMDLTIHYTSDLHGTILDLQSLAGDIAKLARDFRTHGYLGNCIGNLGRTLVCVMAACSRLSVILGVQLADVCKDNIQTLLKRKETNTIKGDGDNREKIAATIAATAKEVESWPLWKQNILTDSGKPHFSQPRQPVNDLAR